MTMSTGNPRTFARAAMRAVQRTAGEDEAVPGDTFRDVAVPDGDEPHCCQPLEVGGGGRRGPRTCRRRGRAGAGPALSAGDGQQIAARAQPAADAGEQGRCAGRRQADAAAHIGNHGVGGQQVSQLRGPAGVAADVLRGRDGRLTVITAAGSRNGAVATADKVALGGSRRHIVGLHTCRLPAGWRWACAAAASPTSPSGAGGCLAADTQRAGMAGVGCGAGGAGSAGTWPGSVPPVSRRNGGYSSRISVT
jgi:hypothetical protein